MSATLTLPGTMEGLLRRCSPVVLVAATSWWDSKATLGIVTSVEPFEVACGTAWEPAERRWFGLGLTDETGRTHAAWWLADRLYDDGPFVAVAIVPGSRLTAPYPHFGLSTITALGGERWRALDCPALDDLDPEDPRLLPDGSRWVDAEALRLVCLHVAGLEVSP